MAWKYYAGTHIHAQMIIFCEAVFNPLLNYP